MILKGNYCIRVIDMDDPMRNEKLEKAKEAGEILLTSVK